MPAKQKTSKKSSFQERLKNARRKKVGIKEEKELPKIKDSVSDSSVRENDRWALERDGLHQSTLEVWLNCREQFRLMVVEGWRSTRNSAAIEYGNLWHWLIGRHYAGRAKESNIGKILMHYRTLWRNENPFASTQAIEDFEKNIAKTIALWPVYCSKFQGTDRKRKWVDMEHEFTVQFRCKDFDDGDEFIVPWHGTCDGVFRDRRGLWLLETKTKGQINEWEIQDTMHLNLQVMVYLCAMWKKFGEVPAGVLYNVIRNPGERLKADESLKEFSERIRENADEDEDHYFKRWEMPCRQVLLDRFWRNQLHPILQDVRRWTKGGPHYVHTAALNGKYGRCGMFGPITAGNFSEVTRQRLEKSDGDRQKSRKEKEEEGQLEPETKTRRSTRRKSVAGKK